MNLIFENSVKKLSHQFHLLSIKVACGMFFYIEDNIFKNNGTIFCSQLFDGYSTISKFIKITLKNVLYFDFF